METGSSATWVPSALPDDESIAEDIAEAEIAKILLADTLTHEPVSPVLEDMAKPSAAGTPRAQEPAPAPVARYQLVTPVMPEVAHVVEAVDDPVSETKASAWEVMSVGSVPRPDHYLFDRILEAARERPVSTVDLASQWGVDRLLVWAALRKLAHLGRVDKVGRTPEIRYALATVGQVEDPPPAAMKAGDRNEPKSFRLDCYVHSSWPK